MHCILHLIIVCCNVLYICKFMTSIHREKEVKESQHEQTQWRFDIFLHNCSELKKMLD